jgi:hypothetical protein
MICFRPPRRRMVSGTETVTLVTPFMLQSSSVAKGPAQGSRGLQGSG